jgi:hypothetical protein
LSLFRCRRRNISRGAADLGKAATEAVPFSKPSAESSSASGQRGPANPVGRDFAPMNLSLSAVHPLF